QQVGDHEFLGQADENSRDADLPILIPNNARIRQLGPEVLVTLNWAGDHRGKEEDECDVFAKFSGRSRAAIAIHRVMNELEREKRNPKRKKRAGPEDGIMCGRSEDKAAQKIPIFENDQKYDCLGDPDEAKR